MYIYVVSIDIWANPSIYSLLYFFSGLQALRMLAKLEADMYIYIYVYICNICKYIIYIYSYTYIHIHI